MKTFANSLLFSAMFVGLGYSIAHLPLLWAIVAISIPLAFFAYSWREFRYHMPHMSPFPVLACLLVIGGALVVNIGIIHVAILIVGGMLWYFLVDRRSKLILENLNDRAQTAQQFIEALDDLIENPDKVQDAASLERERRTLERARGFATNNSVLAERIRTAKKVLAEREQHIMS